MLRIGIVGRDLILETRSPEDAEEERVQRADTGKRAAEAGGCYPDDADGGREDRFRKIRVCKSVEDDRGDEGTPSARHQKVSLVSNIASKGKELE